MIFLQLFLSYLKIGFFGFGGGYAMLALIQHEVVVRHSWMTNTEFTDIVAISQMTPGPIAINSATYVGYTVGAQAGDNPFFGILGSAIATFAVCLPSLTVMLGDEITACGVNAGAVVREAAKLMQGGGGGQNFFATAGGKNPEGLQAAIDKAVELIAAQVK